MVLGVSPEIARRDAEGMEHHVVKRRWMPFVCLPRNTVPNELPFLRTLQGDRFFQLLILVGSD